MMGRLSDLVAKNVKLCNPDSVIVGAEVWRYLVDELHEIGQEGPQYTVFSVPVLTHKFISEHDVVFMRDGKPVGKLTNIRRHFYGLS
jgi:hypothetical protein